MRKKCPGHKKPLPLEAFNADPSRPDGLDTYCKRCKSRQRKNRKMSRRDSKDLRERFEFIQTGEPLKRRIYLGRAENGFDFVSQIVTAE
jgi:hypothetical protein